MSVQWTHLIRFLSSGAEYHGDAILPGNKGVEDIIELAKAGQLRARVVEAEPLAVGTVSKRELLVDRLLSPLTMAQVPIIRCIGLNYTKHGI